MVALGSRSYGVQSYHIGNSLTYDSQGNFVDMTSGLEAIAAAGGHALTAGYHVDNSQALDVIWNDPNGVNLFDPNFWPNALLSSYDFITLQPHQRVPSTLGSDRQHVSDFIGYAAGSPDVFVLQTWPTDENWPYSNYWLSPVVDDPNTPTTKQRQYFDHLMNQVRADNPGTTIWMVPSGEVLYELDQQITAGTLPDVTSLSDFFRDRQHMDRGIGRYMAATTLAATMLQFDPRGLTPPAGFFIAGTTPMTPALVEAVNQTIWSVISSSPWSGYSDFDRDGDIDHVDLATWESSGRPGADFLAWQLQSANAQQAVASQQSIPEPSSALLLLQVLIISLIRKS